MKFCIHVPTLEANSPSQISRKSRYASAARAVPGRWGWGRASAGADMRTIGQRTAGPLADRADVMIDDLMADDIRHTSPATPCRSAGRRCAVRRVPAVRRVDGARARPLPLYALRLARLLLR